MLKIKNYVKAESLQQAYELNQKKSNRLLGGMLWIKMSSAQIQTAIDLSGLMLDQIEETEEEFRIGCMVTLRQIELHQGLNDWFQGMLRDSVKDIVGVQFRNLATVGGSIFGRFGFSDVLTAFLALDTKVELYRGGIVPLAEFVKMPRDRDILVRLIVKKTRGTFAYLSHRNARTDFPVLAVGMSLCGKQARISVGARKQWRSNFQRRRRKRSGKESVLKKSWPGLHKLRQKRFRREAICVQEANTGAIFAGC